MLRYVEYRVKLVGGEPQLHHVTCSESDTLVFSWLANFPEGISMETLLNQIKNHEETIHAIRMTPPDFD